MHIFLATNEKYYSRFMRVIFKEPVSHIAVGFFIGDQDLVLECTKPYGRLIHLRHWQKKYHIVYGMELRLDPSTEGAWYRRTAATAVLSPYDWGAYYYGFWLGIRKWLFGTPFPPHNKGQELYASLCTEILKALKHPMVEYGINLSNMDLAAATPHMIGQERYRQTATNPLVRWYGNDCYKEA